MKEFKQEKSKLIEDSVALAVLGRLVKIASRMSDWEKDLCYDLTHVLEMGGHCSIKQFIKLRTLETKYCGS